LVTWLRGLGVDGPIESYAKRYAAIATDLATGREVWLECGPIHEAVRASIALPGILSPAKVDDKWLVDGGLSNPVPVSVCRAFGADVIIAVNLNGDLLGRRFPSEPPPDALLPAQVPTQLVASVLRQLPPVLREQATQVVQRLLPQRPSTPGYFQSLTQKELSDLSGLWLVVVANYDGATRCPGPRSLVRSIGAMGSDTQAMRPTRNGR
jgi:NTE family protein